MRSRGVARALLILALCAASAGRAQDAATPAPPPAAGPAAPPACGAQAARYDDGKGFAMVVTRIGTVRTENPLRPLTPEVNYVLELAIDGKVATAYGADVAALRRGASPGAVEALLGSPIRWQATLPALPDPIAIVTEEGARLAQLAFRACEAPPAIKAPPRGRSSAPGRGAGSSGAGRRDAGQKTPPGFSMPQGAVPE